MSAVAAPNPDRLPPCADCDHINQGTCVRPIGTHFSAGFNGYRKRLHVSAAMERARRKALDGRVTCGPEGQFFEPKGSSLAMVASVKDETVTDDQIKQMVNRFLAWKLPTDFAPDCGITFERVSCKGTPHAFHFAPTGTNLFSAAQAEQMVRHMLGDVFVEGVPVVSGRDTIADSDGDDGA